MGVASGVDAFDGSSPSETPVGSSVAKGANAPAPARESATGEPGKVSKYNPAVTGATTIQAADSRPTTSGIKRTRAAVDSFGGGTV